MTTKFTSIVLLMTTLTACGGANAPANPADVATKVVRLAFAQQLAEAFDLVEPGPGVTKDDYVAKNSKSAKKMAAVAEHCGGIASVTASELKREGDTAIVSIKVIYKNNTTLSCRDVTITQRAVRQDDSHWRMVDH